jgi:integrase/recombinase XerD
VFKRGDRYVVVWRHRGKQHKQFFRTYAEAREAKGKKTGGESAPATKQRFDLYAREWVAVYQGRTARGLDEDTREGYRRALEAYAIPHFGTLPLRDIGRSDLDQLIAALARKGLSARSIAAYVAPVRAMFADAMERGDVSANPATRLRINAKATAPRRSSKTQRSKDMTRSELAALLSAVPEDQNEGRDRLLFELLAHTGCRISEALGLDWSDLARDGRSVRIERQWYRGTLKPYTKSANGMRTISLSPGLARRLTQRGTDAIGPIFHTRTGLRLSDRNVARVLERAVTAANVPRVSPHSFRHTHGSMLLDEGWPITDVAHRLGDDVQTIARTYAHKLRDSDRDLGFLDDLAS